MKNERNPEIRYSNNGQLKLANFTRTLSRNQENIYQYIPLMVSGDFQSQENSSDYIFLNLRNILSHEMNTNVLKYTSRFIITLMLLGNFHIYERFVSFLLPIFREKITEDYTRKTKPVWPIQLFCRELLFIISQWLPLDFYDESKPSIFASSVQQLKIECEDFKFMTLDKIIISYRIIKALGLDQIDNNCVCEVCRLRKRSSPKMQQRAINAPSNKELRQQLYVLQQASNTRDQLFSTGFEISLEQEVSQLETMIDKKIKSYSHTPHQSIIFYRLKEKMEILEDDIKNVRAKCKQSNNKGRQHLQINNRNMSKQTAAFQTPSKQQLNKYELTTADTHKKIKNHMSSSNQLQHLRSMPNLQLLALQEQFKYKGYGFFEKALNLSASSLQKFKHSLLCFEQKIYLKQIDNISIYCIALAKANKIKIRIYFDGDEEVLSQYAVELENLNLNAHFNEEKYEFTIILTQFQQPIKLTLCGNKNQKFILPIGYIKLLQPLPDSAVSRQKLKFKLIKTIKISNLSIKSYEYLVQKLIFLEKLIEKSRSNKISRLFQGQKLKKRLQRRYRLFQTELVLTISNNQTEYIDIEIECEDTSIHRRKSCELLKEFIFICSNESSSGPA